MEPRTETGEPPFRPSVLVHWFMRHVDTDGPASPIAPDWGPCWEWRGPVGKGRWPQMPVVREDVDYSAWSMSVHQVAYEVFHGPRPAGLVLDHACHNLDPHCQTAGPGNVCRHLLCVRHIQPVSKRENVLRGRIRRTIPDMTPEELAAYLARFEPTPWPTLQEVQWPAFPRFVSEFSAVDA